MPKQKLRAIDDLRTRYNPLCKVEAFKTEEETSSIGVSRSGDDLSNASRAASVSKVIGVSSRPYLPARTRKSRRLACATLPVAASVWGDFMETEPEPDVYDVNQGIFDSDEDSASVLDSSLGANDYGSIFTQAYSLAPPTPPHTLYSGPYPLGGMALDQWHHVTFTRKSSGSSSIYRQYIDGFLTSQIVDIAPMSNATTADPLRAGGLGRAYGYDVNRVLNGKMDQVATWDRALTPSQVSDLYNDGDGVEYSAMSAGLLSGIHQCFEFPEAVGVHDPNRVGGPPWWLHSTTHDLIKSSGGGDYAGERVSGGTSQVELGGHYNYTNHSLSQPGGKVSAHAFTPQWIDGTGETHGNNPDTGAPWTYFELAAKYSGSGSHKALLMLDENVAKPNDPSNEYTISAWFSKHGLSGGTTTMDDIATSTTGFPLSANRAACCVLSGYKDIGHLSLVTWVWSFDYERDPSYWAWNL